MNGTGPSDSGGPASGFIRNPRLDHIIEDERHEFCQLQATDRSRSGWPARLDPKASSSPSR